MEYNKILLMGKPEYKQRFRFKTIMNRKVAMAYKAGLTKNILAKYGLQIITYDPKSDIVTKTKLMVRSQWRYPIIKTGVYLEFYFYMYVPKGTTKTDMARIMSSNVEHLKKPDLSNMEKFYEDVMSGIVYRDDKQIWGKTSYKYYSVNPRVVIYVKEGKAWD